MEQIKHGLELMKRLSLAPARELVNDSQPPIMPDAIVDYYSAWAVGVSPRGPQYWPREVERRKGILEALRQWSPPKALGNAPLLSDVNRQALMQIVESGPIPAVHGVVRWRLIDLVQWVFEEFRISISKQTLSRELRALGFRKLSARPRHHAQDAEALVAFKKTSPPASTRSPSVTRQASR